MQKTYYSRGICLNLGQSKTFQFYCTYPPTPAHTTGLDGSDASSFRHGIKNLPTGVEFLPPFPPLQDQHKENDDYERKHVEPDNDVLDAAGRKSTRERMLRGEPAKEVAASTRRRKGRGGEEHDSADDMDIQGNEEEGFTVGDVPAYEVEALIGKRFSPRVEYLVRWKGLGSSADTWLPVANLSAAKKLVTAFNSELRKSQAESRKKRKRW